MNYHEGSIVRVQLYDGRIVEAEVKAVLDTVTGRKLRIKFGDFVNTVGASHVVEGVPSSSRAEASIKLAIQEFCRGTKNTEVCRP